MNSKDRKSTYASLLIIILFFAFFFCISRWMPVVGDDWGYALGGTYHNPFVMAARNYMTWSGRFLSELWGFTIAPHKGIWNLLNTLLFTGILVLLIFLSAGNKNGLKKPLIAIAAVMLMLTVPNGVRMQTYTWIMGTTYVIPLFLFLIYILILKAWIFDSHVSKWRMAVMAILNVAVPLYMENAATLIVAADLLVLVYLLAYDRTKLKHMLLLTVFGVAGLCIIKFSPGASARMLRDHADFNSLSLFGKISQNWSSFINLTFMEDAWLTRVLSIIMMVFVCRHRKECRWPLLIILELIFAYGVLQSFSWQLMDWTGAGFTYILADISIPHSLQLNTIGYLGQLLAVLYCIIRFEKNPEQRWFLVFLYLCAIGADAVMLISPIFDARSSLYTLYLEMLFVLTLFADTKMESATGIMIGCIAGMIAVFSAKSYLDLYYTVHLVTEKRSAQIDYYRQNPQSEEAWLIAYPDQSIHSGNITSDDTYHLETFKEYYGLSKDLKLNFYWLADYSPEAIAKG